MKGPSLEGGKGITQRRSQRLFLQVAVIVRRQGQGEFTEDTQTLVVNAHGALVTLAAPVQMGQTLFLKNRVSGEECACRVVYLGPPAGDKGQVGLEFTAPAPQFWHISFPPDDWATSASGKRPR
jgi:hypothetical protein